MQDAIRSGSKKIALRILPLLCLGYVIAYLDRINVSFAALQLNEDLALSPAAYGLGAGLFFVGLCRVRGAEQPRFAARRRQVVDLTDHDQLGRHLRLDGLRSQ